ncbi:Homeodomain-interacting protein kinase 3 [Nibea albiflora]|uniref:Homeodomain-interacting protein kinase 3 n=1 Tax=Nibea albiflora TaxID=240163 RepID=A0ACB7F7Q4_NIBAL|nr:Homeodomain-interacting protein kinase 3 [Nibea albiflora]
MLQLVRTLNPEKNNIVNFIEDFRFNNLSCLAFEMLDRDLWDLLEERRWILLNLNEIRPIVHQVMVAFDALKSIGVLHTDLKPENIMLINHQDQPFKIKLIDFGLARRVNEVDIGTMMQPSSFRAPEVTVGLPLTEAVDRRPSTPLFCGDNLPQVGHEVLQDIIIEEMFNNKLQAEKKKNILLQEELQRLCVSYQLIIASLRAEQEALRQKMAEEITVLQQNAFEKEKIYGRELDELKTQLSVQISLNLKLSAGLKAETEANQKKHRP